MRKDNLSNKTVSSKNKGTHHVAHYIMFILFSDTSHPAAPHLSSGFWPIPFIEVSAAHIDVLFSRINWTI